MAPGEAPQPLTLNHPALSPGRFCGRGFLIAIGLRQRAGAAYRWMRLRIGLYRSLTQFADGPGAAGNPAALALLLQRWRLRACGMCA
jgi:hypothetical protein